MSLKTSGSTAAAAAAVAAAVVASSDSSSSSSSSISWIPTLALASAGLAACGVLVLTALQSDLVRRKFLRLSPQDLQVQRQSEYIYQWSHALQRAKLQMQYYLAGCGNNNNYITGKRSIAQYQANDEMARTRFISTQQTEDLQDLVDQICSGKLQGCLRVARIGKDDATTKRSAVSSTGADGEYYVWLIQQQSPDVAVHSSAAAVVHNHDDDDHDDVYQVPLGPFCLLLADAMEGIVTATTFCFVSDASAGLASRLVVDLVAAAFKGGTGGSGEAVGGGTGTSTTTTSVVATVEEPLWMACLAVILQQGVLSANTSERILFALCRLEAATLAAACASKTATILITLPGQATTATLLPLVQKVFPYDRHVFGYTGCIRTVEHSAWLRRRRMSPQSQRGYIPETLAEVLTISHNPVIHTTPLLSSIAGSSGNAAAAAAHRRSPLLRSSSIMPPFLAALKELPINYADTVETWMTAVDAFLEMKENEKRNGYHPYVLKLDYLLLSNRNSTEIKEGTDRYWSLLSLLQYVTGSKSRAMASERIDAASSWLLSQQQQPHIRYTNTTTALTKATTLLPVVLDTADRRKIEQAVFQHKRILIENKTLVDTVQPKQHWSLKATLKKFGCACCGPQDDDEEEEEEEEEKAGNTTMSKKQQKQSPFEMGGDLTGGGARAAAGRETTFTGKVKDSRGLGGYVDGKMGFAFDPSKFKVT